MKVRKLKVLDAGITVEGEKQNGGHPETVILDKCPDAPTEELTEALEALHPEVCRILGFDSEKLMKRVTLTGLSASEDANGHRQFIFHTKVMTNAGQSSFNSPRMREQVEAEDGATVLSDVTMKRVEALLAAGVSYYEGPREQGELDLGEAADG